MAMHSPVPVAPPPVGDTPGSHAPASPPGRSSFVQDVLPFFSSLLFHVGLIVIGLLTLKVVQDAIPSLAREQVIVPDPVFVDRDARAGGLPNPGIGDPTRTTAQDKFPDVLKDSPGISASRGQNLLASLTPGGAGEEAGIQLIGIGGGGIGAGGGLGAGKGDGVGTGAGDGLPAPFGAPGGSGIGPRGIFERPGGNVRKVVYLCDASGTMLGVFDNLRVEMRKSIESLKPVQSFNIVFFSDDNAIVLEKNGLLMATPDNKRKAFDFIERSYPRGTTNPMPAIRAAFACNPELIHCLTDGFDAVASFEEVAGEFRRHNADNRVKANTLLIESSDQPELTAILRRIAKENGGVFKPIRRADW